MSLEELRAQVAAEESVESEEESGKVESLELEEDEAKADEPDENEDEPIELSEDFELELEGEPVSQQEPTPEEALIHKLSKERRKRKEEQSENEQLKKRLEELEKRLTQPAQQVQQPTQSHAGEPTFPDMYDPGIEGDRKKYDAAVKKYFADMEAYRNRHSEADKANADFRAQLDAMTKNLAVNAAKFATDNKVSVDRVANALNTATDDVDAATGIDGSFAYLLDSVGEGSERVAYYIGTNQAGRDQLKKLLEDDPKGLKAIAHMTRLAEKLKPKQAKQVSKAPEPDQAVKGDAVEIASAKQLQKEYDAATKFDDLMKIRRKAREAGVKLITK